MIPATQSILLPYIALFLWNKHMYEKTTTYVQKRKFYLHKKR